MTRVELRRGWRAALAAASLGMAACAGSPPKTTLSLEDVQHQPVRVSLQSGDWRDGALLGSQDQTLLFQERLGGPVDSIHVRDVRGVFVRGEKGPTFTGIFLGTILGATAGWFVGIYPGLDCEGECYGWGEAGLIGAAVGGAVGGFIGSRFHSDRWHRVDLGLHDASNARSGGK